MKRFVLVWLLALSACDSEVSVDAGVGDAETHPDASPLDSGGLDAGVRDGSSRDSGPSDSGPFVCNSLATTSSKAWAKLSGRIELVDFDYFDETFGVRSRVRNAGLNFRTRNLPIRASLDVPLFSSLPVDACLAVDIPALVDLSGPARNVGAQILVRDERGAIFVRFIRTQDVDGPRYDFATQTDAERYFDPRALEVSNEWTYELVGDSAAGIRPGQATVPPLVDFEISPAFTNTSSVTLNPMGTTVRWSATSSSAMSIVLDRATDPEGGGRYLVCNVLDDGEFTILEDEFQAFGALPEVPFGITVARSAFVPICTDGLSGAVSHVLAYTGVAVVR